MDAKGGGVTRQDLDWHTVSLLMDYHSLNYRGKVVEREVAEVAGGNFSLEKNSLPKTQVSRV